MSDPGVIYDLFHEGAKSSHGVVELSASCLLGNVVRARTREP
jgi:hypothetical protein